MACQDNVNSTQSLGEEKQNGCVGSTGESNFHVSGARWTIWQGTITRVWYPFIVLTWVRIRTKIKAKLIIFPLHYSAGVGSITPLRTNVGKLSKVESLLDFG